MSTSHPPQIRIRSVSVHSTMDGEQTIPPSWKDLKQRPSFSPREIKHQIRDSIYQSFIF